MENPTPPILPETFEAMVTPWLQGIARKDIVAVVSYPASDRQRRLLNLLDNRRLQKKYLGKPNQYLWISIDFRVDPVDNTVELEALILRRVAEQFHPGRRLTGNFGVRMTVLWRRFHKKVVVAAMGCETLLLANKAPLLIWFTVMMRSDILRMLLFLETNLFAPAALEIFGRIPAFQPRIAIMRLYNREDTLQFIGHMEHEWRFRVPEAMKQRIVTDCGGLLLLVKEALWYCRDHPKRSEQEMFKSHEMRFNLLSFWQGLDTDCQMLIDRIIKKETTDSIRYASSIDYLMQAGFVRQRPSGLTINVPLIARFRRDILNQGMPLTQSDGGHILVDGVNVSKQFTSAQRRILGYFLHHANEILSRDAIAQHIWPTNTADRYSDWAIDSHISRLRQRLTSLGVDAMRLETVKGRGFRFRTTTL